jgi:hypothetical protein
MCLWKPVAAGLIGAGLFLLVGCAPLTPAQDAAAAATVPRIEARAAAVDKACARVMPLAGLALAIPEVGPGIALGVRVGCGTARGMAKLLEDDESALWLGQQEQMLKAAIARPRRLIP